MPLPGGRHLGLLDTMVVTKWDPPRLVEVQHTGRVIRGPGIFEIEPRGEHATFVWTERFYLPWGWWIFLAVEEAIAFGAVGATCNPVIALTTIEKHLDVWGPRIAALAEQPADVGVARLELLGD